jgi:hypothetical protein
MKMTREEHLQWCKDRALQYVDENDLPQALASMMSDLSKHDETKQPADSILNTLGLVAAMSGNPDEMRRFINGCN